MAEIIKVYMEQFPAVRLIGRRYSNAQRDAHGSYATTWNEWFENKLFEPLEAACGCAADYLGFMRCDESDFARTFKYWIGVFAPSDTEVPQGYEFLDIPQADVAICWIQGGQNDAGIYAMHEACMSAFAQNSMGNFMRDEENRTYFFERYNCPRFTEPDTQGNIILDYGIYVS